MRALDIYGVSGINTRGMSCGCSSVDPITEECLDPEPCTTDSGGSYQIPYPTGTPGNPTTTYPYPTGPSSTNWATAISNIMAPITNIFKTRYAVPQLNPGQLIQSGPYGTIMSQSSTGIPGNASLTSALGGSSGSLLLFGGIGVVVLLAMSRKG